MDTPNPSIASRFGQAPADAPQRFGQATADDDAGVPAPMRAGIEPPKDGRLTRAHMEQIIVSGGSVIHEGTLIERVADLPGEVDLARGDAARTAAVRDSLDDQIARLQSQRSRLDQPAPAPKPEPKPEPPPAKPTDPKK